VPKVESTSSGEKNKNETNAQKNRILIRTEFESVGHDLTF
jgi:hypothetical protein